MVGETTMGNGLYGENQGDESRAAGRGTGETLLAERIEENHLVEGDIVQGPYSVGGKNYQTGWRAMFQLGMWDTLKVAVEEIRQQWYSEFTIPQPEEGEKGDHYANRVKREQSVYRHRVDERIASMLTTSTVGECAIMRRDGKSFKNGWRIRPKREPQEG